MLSTTDKKKLDLATANVAKAIDVILVMVDKAYKKTVSDPDKMTTDDGVSQLENILEARNDVVEHCDVVTIEMKRIKEKISLIEVGNVEEGTKAR